MKENTVNARLVAHKGALPISRGNLFAIPAPPRTLTHTPVAHRTLIELMEQRLADHKFAIRQEEYAIQHYGARLFGILKLKAAVSEDASFAMAFRASNDKSMALEAIAGLNVFVCDNMALAGDRNVLYRKHTSSLDIRTEVFSAVDLAISEFGSLKTSVERLKNQFISNTEAKALIYDATVKGIIPQRLLPEVGKEYFEPRHPEFKPRTMWSLHNAGTEIFKQLRPNIAMECTQGWSSLLTF